MRKWLFGFFALGALLGFTEAALAAEVKATDVVAQIDTFKITVSDLHKKLAAFSPNLPDKNLEERKKRALDELITDYLLNEKARSLSLERDTAFVKNADFQLSQVATRLLFNKAVTEAISVADSEAAVQYAQHPEQYRTLEWVRASHILITPVKDTFLLTAHQRRTGWWADNDPKASAIADSIYHLIQREASFDSMARLWSQDMATGLSGGDLGKFERKQMVPEFEETAFRIKPGEISPPVKTQFGYHIIKVTEKQGEMTAPFSDSLKEVIVSQLRNQKATDRAFFFLDSLQRAFGVTYNERFVKEADSLLNEPDSARTQERFWAAASAAGDTVWSDFALLQMIRQIRMFPDKHLDREQKMDLLKNLINPRLLRQAMVNMKISESEYFQRKKEEIYQAERLSRVRRGALLDYTPSEGEARAYFNAHRGEFVRRESLSVNVQQMVFKNKTEAEKILWEVEQGGDFALLAKKYFQGDPALAGEVFNLGFISPPAMPADFFAVAETLSLGTVSRPVKTEWGYHLIRVVARQPDFAYESAKPQIFGQLQKARQEEHKRKWGEDLRVGHQIKINERLLKKIKDPSLEKLSSGSGN